MQPLLPQPDRRRGGRPRVHSTRLVIDTILHVLTTGGLLLEAVVHPAGVQDRHGAERILTGITDHHQSGLVWGEGGCVSSGDASLVDRAATRGTTVVAVPRNADVRGFRVLPGRRAVERISAWFVRRR